MSNEPKSDENKPKTTGREDSQASDDNLSVTETASGSSSVRKASVIIRASVEHVGLVGETELTVNVKWPVSAFCVPPCAKPATASDATGDPRNLPANAPPAKIRTVTGTK